MLDTFGVFNASRAQSVYDSTCINPKRMYSSYILIILSCCQNFLPSFSHHFVLKLDRETGITLQQFVSTKEMQSWKQHIWKKLKNFTQK